MLETFTYTNVFVNQSNATDLLRGKKFLTFFNPFKQISDRDRILNTSVNSQVSVFSVCLDLSLSPGGLPGVVALPDGGRVLVAQRQEVEKLP